MPAPPTTELPDIFGTLFAGFKDFAIRFWYFLPIAIGATYLKAKAEQKADAEKEAKASQRTKRRTKDRLEARDEYIAERKQKAESEYKAGR